MDRLDDILRGDGANLWFPTACAFGTACLLAHSVSRVLSPLLFKSFSSLSTDTRKDWNSRASSTLHAVVITACAARIILFSDLFSDAADSKVSPMYRTSSESNIALGMSLGYFVTDLLMMTIHYPHMGGAEMVAHHVAALVSVLRTLQAQYAHFYTLAMLSTEVTTPFINARWQMDRCGMRAHPAYLVNGLMVMLLWLTNRVLMFGPFFWHEWEHREELRGVHWFDKVLLVGVPLLLLALNSFWFAKIINAVIRAANARKATAAKKGADLAQAVPSAGNQASLPVGRQQPRGEYEQPDEGEEPRPRTPPPSGKGPRRRVSNGSTLRQDSWVPQTSAEAGLGHS